MNPVLKDIHFKVGAGEVIAIVGVSAAPAKRPWSI